MKKKYLLTNFNENMLMEEVINGSCYIKPVGLVNVEKVKEVPDLVVCIGENYGLYRHLQNLGFDLDCSERADKVYINPGDIFYVISGKLGKNVIQLRDYKEREFEDSVVVECHKYITMPNDEVLSYEDVESEINREK